MTFCEQMCPFFQACEIREPENGGRVELTVAGVFEACRGREYLLEGYYINCRHLACKQGEGIACERVKEDTTGELLIPFWSVEKGKGRFINKLTGDVYSTNRAGKIGKTGQVIKL